MNDIVLNIIPGIFVATAAIGGAIYLGWKKMLALVAVSLVFGVVYIRLIHGML